MFPQSRGGDCDEALERQNVITNCQIPEDSQTHLVKAKVSLQIGRGHMELRILPIGMGGWAARQNR
jgi:hypothetical protein